MGPCTQAPISGIDDSNKLATFDYVVRALDKLNIGYLCLREPNAEDVARGVQIENVVETFRPMTAVPIVANTGFDKVSGNALLARSGAEMVAFGTPFIANPDLVERFREDIPLSTPDAPSTFYGAGKEGYTDYPVALARD